MQQNTLVEGGMYSQDDWANRTMWGRNWGDLQNARRDRRGSTLEGRLWDVCIPKQSANLGKRGGGDEQVCKGHAEGVQAHGYGDILFHLMRRRSSHSSKTSSAAPVLFSELCNGCGARSSSVRRRRRSRGAAAEGSGSRSSCR